MSRMAAYSCKLHSWMCCTSRCWGQPRAVQNRSRYSRMQWARCAGSMLAPPHRSTGRMLHCPLVADHIPAPACSAKQPFASPWQTGAARNPTPALIFHASTWQVTVVLEGSNSVWVFDWPTGRLSSLLMGQLGNICPLALSACPDLPHTIAAGSCEWGACLPACLHVCPPCQPL